MSRRLEFHGEVYHGTTGEIAKQAISGGQLLMSTHGAAGPGVYVTSHEDEAGMYGDHVLRGYAEARNVLPARIWNDTKLSTLAGFSGEHAERVRQHLLDRGYDAVEDSTVRGAVSLLHPRQFDIGSIRDPQRGHYVDALSYLEEVSPSPSRSRRRRAPRPTVTKPEQLWSPETFGH